MDLVSTIRKSGSRGGVNFSWDEVANSAHRENYLGHSLKAPVGRWQQGRDLGWYAKADASDPNSNETEEEAKARRRREEIQKIKEAEEDAMAAALGLPPPVRNQSGANAIEVSGSRAMDDEDDAAGGLQVTKREEKGIATAVEAAAGKDTGSIAGEIETMRANRLRAVTVRATEVGAAVGTRIIADGTGTTGRREAEATAGNIEGRREMDTVEDLQIDEGVSVLNADGVIDKYRKSRRLRRLQEVSRVPFGDAY
ncbi:hypothetical protein SLS63_006890 [Diaporthe eres]|uniref:Multiple myeloma tumor-associated protein 2-like N-terminal domain-containing protein n=1 Tax=Diaporthe eres TaxID=83184 RepID=A0ABR1P764_DIAER